MKISILNLISSNNLQVKKRNYLQLLLEAHADESTIKQTNQSIDYTKIHMEKKLTLDVMMRKFNLKNLLKKNFFVAGNKRKFDIIYVGRL